MKYLSFAVFGALVQAGASATGCVSGDFSLDVKGYCNHTALLISFTEWFVTPGNVAPGCASTAEEELARLLNATDPSTEVHGLCRSAYVNYGGLPFETSTRSDARFVQEYYRGNSDWNEQVASGEGDNIEMLLKHDAAVVDQFHDGEGRHSILDLPDLPNFDNCAMNAAYCCWPKDRQANDRNGNCDDPYDYNCVDSDPGDNTDLCFVDIADGANSTGYNTKEGWFTFPFDDNNKNLKAEGPIHCHGFAWADDENDPSQVYRGNNLFFVSLFDHMFTRGYVGHIPGAPMCACAEQMPTVSRADCTQIDFENQEHDFVFTFRKGVVSAELVSIFIDFNACQGLDEDFDDDGNDLWSYVNRLFLEDKISGDKLQMLRQKLVGDNNCEVGQQKGLAENGMVRGFTNLDEDVWTQVAGRDSLDDGEFYGRAAFEHIIDSDNNTTLPILRRGCASCFFDQQWLYYKRVTPIPEDLDLFWDLKYGRAQAVGNVYSTDFLIYGSYEDALNDENAWSCPNYQYKRGFPGDCGPNGTTRSGQSSRFDDRNGRPDVAWFAENKGRELHAVAKSSQAGFIARSASDSFSGLVTTAIGINSIPGDAYTDVTGDTLFVSASGKDIWGEMDNMRFTYEDFSGDLTLSVKVSGMDYREHWTKAGLMVRDSLDPAAKHFSVLMTGKRDVTTTWRSEDGGRSYGAGHSRTDVLHKSIWLKLTKRFDTFRGFKSFDGENWEQVSEFRNVFMNETDLKVGLAVTSHHHSRITEVKFENYVNETYEFPTSAPTSTPAPSFGHEALDLGNYDTRYPSDVDIQGDKTVIKATGRDIWGRADSFTFINHQVEGDFNMTVHVNHLSSPHQWSKMGLMVRDSLAPDAKHLSLFLVPKRGIIRHARRLTGERTWNLRYHRMEQNSTWLRIERHGDVFTCYTSLVGNTDDSEWHLVKAGESFDSSYIDFGTGPLEVGIAMTSHNSRVYAEAEFEHFALLEASPTVNATVPTTRKLRGGSLA